MAVICMVICLMVDGDCIRRLEGGLRSEGALGESRESSDPDGASLAVAFPRVNWIESPVGVDSAAPSFSWELVSDGQDVMQKAYQIMLWQDKNGQKSVLWDSGKVAGSKASGILYGGSALKSQETYQWEVTVWDEKGRSAGAGSFFQTAYIGEEALRNAVMIRMQDDENVYDEGQAVFYKDFVMKDKPVRKATLTISALGIYEAYINGRRVGDTLLAPGWSSYDKSLYYNTYDITEFFAADASDGDAPGREYTKDGEKDRVTGKEAEDGEKDRVTGQGEEMRIAVMLGTGWWCGRVAFGTYDYHKPAWIGTIRIVYEDGGIEELQTDESWNYVKDTAVVSADIFNGEVYDAHKPTAAELSVKGGEQGALVRQAVISTDFDGEYHSFYGAAVQHVEAFDCRPTRVVVYDSVSANGTDYGEIHIKQESTWQGELALLKGETAVFDLGQNMVGVPYITYEAEDGTEVFVDFAEMLNDSGSKEKGNDGPKGSLYTANYRSAGSALVLISDGEGMQEYQPSFSYYGFRYLSVTASDDIRLHQIKGCFIGNSSLQTGWLLTDHELLNRLYENVRWTQRNNFLTVATDCPQRDERLGWMGDLQVFAKTSLYNQDLMSFYQKWGMDCMESQTAQGAYTDTVPRTITTGSGNAGWGDGGISVPYDVYRIYGDESFLRRSYASMQLYMDYLSSISSFGESGGRIGPMTTYGDWLGYEDSDKEMVSVLYYAKDASQMTEIARILKDKKRQRSYHKLYNRIRDYFRQAYVDDGHIRPEYRTQTALVLAMEYGMLEEGEEQMACEDLLEKLRQSGGTLSTGFLGTPVILKTLSEHGKLAEAYDLLLQTDNPSWLYSVLQGATTIWERYDSYTLEHGFADAAMNSFDHFNNGSVAEWMYESMLGIKVWHDVDDETPPILLKPGILLDADKAVIRHVEGGYHSIYGDITVSWEIGKDGITYRLQLPANCRARLELPVEGKANPQSNQICTIGSGTYTYIYHRDTNEWIREQDQRTLP